MIMACLDASTAALASKYPTAHALVREIAATPVRTLTASLPAPPGLGLGTTVHLTPSHRSVKVEFAGKDWCDVVPTAHALTGELAATASRSEPGAASG